MFIPSESDTTLPIKCCVQPREEEIVINNEREIRHYLPTCRNAKMWTIYDNSDQCIEVVNKVNNNVKTLLICGSREQRDKIFTLPCVALCPDNQESSKFKVGMKWF